jgi:RimJ/RimL family protein N-acetyltransferase
MFSGTAIRLRPIEIGDAAALLPLLNSPELVGRRYLPSKASNLLPLSDGDVDHVVEKWRGGEKQANYAIVTVGDERLVGYCGLGWAWDPHSPWTSVVVEPTQWRRGYGTEALGMLLDFAFGSTVAHSISCWIVEWNLEGLAFAESLGFKRSGKVRRAGIKDGAWYDAVPMDLLRREWAVRRKDGAGHATDG